MVNFKISRSLKAGKIYFIARSRSGTIRRNNLKELKTAIEEYNARIEAGEIKVEDSHETLKELTEETIAEEPGKEERKKETVISRSRVSRKSARTIPKKFLGYRR